MYNEEFPTPDHFFFSISWTIVVGWVLYVGRTCAVTVPLGIIGNTLSIAALSKKLKFNHAYLHQINVLGYDFVALLRFVVDEMNNTTVSNSTVFSSDEQAVSSYAPYLGAAFILVTMPGLIASILCIVIVMKLGYLKPSAGSFYQLVLHLLVCDTGQLLTLSAFGKC